MEGTKSDTGASAPLDKTSQTGIGKAGAEKLSTPSATLPSTASPASTATYDTVSARVGSDSKPVPASGPSRAPYVPQFSAATQMILKRMRGETGGLASALAAGSVPTVSKTNTPPATYESVKDRLLDTFSSGKAVTPTVTTPAPSSPASTPPATLRLPVSSASKMTAISPLTQINKKRKRANDDSSEASSLAEASDYGEGIKKRNPKPSAPNTPTTTKSGRHILKPDTYDPAAEDNMRKRNQLGKRTTEQALCKKCTRMHSPANNQMVFCDGCNDPWHQRCHEPWIEDEIIKDPTVKWYCARCAVKRERLQPKKRLVEPQPQQQPVLGAWPNSTAQEKRAYLTRLPATQLVELLMHATDLHPDLPIFPTGPTARKAPGATMPRGLFAGMSTDGLFHRSEANPTAQLNFIRKIPTNAKKSTIAKARSGPGSLQSKAAAQAQSSRSSGHQLLPEEEDASFTKLWPKPGMGMYSRLVPDEDDDSQLVDDHDYDAFSVIVFDERGKKIEENGVKV